VECCEARCATSLGGFETLIERRSAPRAPEGVPEGLLRLLVGPEGVDGQADLTQAIETAAAAPAA
jgi:cystathionine beta-lyase/cystathionine gamma-synthase